MNFQFSIARLLMATAMVALIFGLARMMLDKSISSYVIFIAVLAADLGLLVLVAQKRSDIYRILRTIALMFFLIFGISGFFTFMGGPMRNAVGVLVLSLITVSMLLLYILFNKLTIKAESRENLIVPECRDENDNSNIIE